MNGEIRSRFDAQIERSGISLKSAIERLLTFYCDQDELTQAMILGQIPPREDVIELILRNLLAKSSHSAAVDEERLKAHSKGTQR
jgi:hypothetical protein